jgi:hypothetical protein
MTPRPISIKLFIAGKLKNERSKSVLMNNIINQDSHDHAYLARPYHTSIHLENGRNLRVSIHDSTLITHPTTLTNLSKDADIVILSYDDFDKKSIDDELKTLKTSVKKDATFYLIGLKKTGHSISNQREAIAYARKMGLSHHIMFLNEVKSINTTFFSFIEKKLGDLGLDESRVFEACNALSIQLKQKNEGCENIENTQAMALS